LTPLCGFTGWHSIFAINAVAVVIVLTWIADHGTMPTTDALEQLLSDLMSTLSAEVPSVLRSQRRALLVVAVLFVITAVYSTVLLV